MRLLQLNENLKAVEAVLFAMGDLVDEFRLSEAIGVARDKVTSLIDSLNEHYDECGSALNILKLSGGYQMSTKSETAEYIRSAMENKRQAPLSNAAMEALTIVAYNQPVSKSFVENVRGIDSSSVINSLVEKGLLEENGRLEVPGHPVAYITTPAFLRCFGLSSLNDLPPLVREGSGTENESDSEESALL